MDQKKDFLLEQSFQTLSIAVIIYYQLGLC